MTGFPVLGKSFQYLLCNSQDPPKIQNRTCDQLDAIMNHTLRSSWNNCMDTKKSDEENPELKYLKPKEKRAHAIGQCCNQILQCNNQNDWLKKKDIPVRCAIPDDPVQPHFGDVKYNTLKPQLHSMMYGVF